MFSENVNSGRNSPLGSMHQTGAEPSGQLFPCNGESVGRNDRRPDIAFERAPALPGAAVHSETALEPRYSGLDARPEPTQTLVDMLAPAHLERLQAALFGKAYVFDLLCFCSLQILPGSKSTVQRRFERVAPIDLLLPIAHHFRQGDIRGVAFNDPAIEDQIRPAAGKTHFVSVNCVAAVLDDDIGVLLEDRYHLTI